MAAIYQWFDKVNFLEGICTDSDQLQVTNLHTPAPMSRIKWLREAYSIEDHVTDLEDTKTASFTALFVRTSKPDLVGDSTPGTGYYAPIIYYSLGSSLGKDRFIMYIDGRGHIQITARNSSATAILQCTVTGINGDSLCDSTQHLITGAFNLADSSLREIFVDGIDVTNNPARCYWETYTDDNINWKPSPIQGASLFVGKSYLNPSYPAFSTEGAGWNGDDGYQGGAPYYTGLGDRLALVSLDNKCSLLSAMCGTNNGWISDPLGWEGWYETQPLTFMALQHNQETGRCAPYNTTEEELGIGGKALNLSTGSAGAWKGGREVDFTTKPSRIINHGMTTEMIETWDANAQEEAPKYGVYVPGTDPRVEIATPHWTELPQGGDTDLVGKNWVDLTKYTTTSFLAAFGQEINGGDFDGAVTVNTAIEVTPPTSYYKLRLTTGSVYALPYNYWTNFDDAALVLCNAAGDIVDWQYSYNVATTYNQGGMRIEIPYDGNPYYIVATSDTGLARIQLYNQFSGI